MTAALLVLSAIVVAGMLALAVPLARKDRS